jgi:hypothetical protein
MTSPTEISSLMFPYSFPTAKTGKYVVFRRAPETERVHIEIKFKRGNITTKSCLYDYNIQKKREK